MIQKWYPPPDRKRFFRPTAPLEMGGEGGFIVSELSTPINFEGIGQREASRSGFRKPLNVQLIIVNENRWS